MAQADEHLDAWVGRPLKRREDHRLLVGAGRYVDDIHPAGCLHLVVLGHGHHHPSRTLTPRSAQAGPCGNAYSSSDSGSISMLYPGTAGAT